MKEMKEMKDFTEDMLQPNKRTVVVFKAPWCSPCKQLTPVLEEINEESFEILHVNTDKNQDLVIKYGIEVVPTLKVFEGFDVVKTVTGVSSSPKTEVIQKINA